MNKLPWLALALVITADASGGKTMEPSGCMPSYEEGEGTLASDLKVVITERAPKVLPSGSKEQVTSPHGTGTLTTYFPKRPGESEIILAIHSGRGSDMFLSFKPAAGASSRWLNEDLVFISVVWGNIVSSEMIFDAQNKTFLYRKLTNYGFVQIPECGQSES